MNLEPLLRYKFKAAVDLVARHDGSGWLLEEQPVSAEHLTARIQAWRSAGRCVLAWHCCGESCNGPAVRAAGSRVMNGGELEVTSGLCQAHFDELMAQIDFPKVDTGHQKLDSHPAAQAALSGA